MEENKYKYDRTLSGQIFKKLRKMNITSKVRIREDKSRLNFKKRGKDPSDVYKVNRTHTSEEVIKMDLKKRKRDDSYCRKTSGI